MKNKEPISYVVGMLLNFIGYFVGSNILVQSVSKLIVPMSEYQGYLLWYISGLSVAWVGNVLGILVISPKNVVRTIIGSLIGLAIGLSLSFIPIPLLCIGGIVTVFLGSLIGHYKDQKTVSKESE